MAANTMSSATGTHDLNKHPKGLYVLFATEMWERFSFYSMLALFTLYLQNPDEGFGWSAARATGLSLVRGIEISCTHGEIGRAHV